MSDRYFPKRKINYKQTTTAIAKVVVPVLVFGSILFISQNLSMDNVVSIRIILRYGAALISLTGVAFILYHFIKMLFSLKGK